MPVHRIDSDRQQIWASASTNAPFNASKALENARQNTAELSQRWTVTLNRSLEDAQKSAEAFLNANPDMKQLVGKVEEMKGKAFSTVGSFSKRLSSTSGSGTGNDLWKSIEGGTGPWQWPRVGGSVGPGTTALGVTRVTSESWLGLHPSVPGQQQPPRRHSGDATGPRLRHVPRVVTTPNLPALREDGRAASEAQTGHYNDALESRLEDLLQGPRQLLSTTQEGVQKALEAARTTMRRVSSTTALGEGVTTNITSFTTGGNATAMVQRQGDAMVSPEQSVSSSSGHKSSSSTQEDSPRGQVVARDGNNAVDRSWTGGTFGGANGMSLAEIGNETEQVLREAEEGKGLGVISFGPFHINLPIPGLSGGLAQANEKLRARLGSIRDGGRKMAVVTTAALPWLTGTAVNPLLRAAYLARDTEREVTLVVPWLAPADQRVVYPHGLTFESPDAQAQFIKDWCEKRTGFDCGFKVRFYPGRYAPEKGSILAVGDITSYIPKEEADIAILEEPEHLNWYHHGPRWTNKFNHVVGIVHTNYLDYARREDYGEVKSLILRGINSWVSRVHCHKVIKLSGAVQKMPRESTENVHGVSPAFLKVGKERAEMVPEDRFKRGVYFIGKVVWAKGYTELLDLLKQHQDSGHSRVHVDVYGAGDDFAAVQETAETSNLDMAFHGARDHLDPSIHDYKIFVNPSTSDVVATTTAEALAMGEFVVVEDLPCNQFFKQFDNCLVYSTPQEFSECLQRALREQPKPMSDAERYRLTWEAATQRFLDAAEIDDKGRTNIPERMFDSVAASTIHHLTGVEWLRQAVGAGANTKHNPEKITAFEPNAANTGGFFDNKARATRVYDKASGVGPTANVVAETASSARSA